MCIVRAAETFHTHKPKMRHSAIIIIPAFFLFTALQFSGCGGGGGGGSTYTPPAPTSDTTNPIVQVTYPASAERIYDVEFVSSDFHIKFTYNDASAINLSSIRAYMQMDSGAAQDISGYITQVSLPAANTYQLAGLHNYTRTLFNVTSNTTTRTIYVSVAARDSAGNLGRSATTTFIVPPAAPPQ